MRCLIRRVTRKSKAGTGHTSREIDSEVLSIGRATDQDVFLSDLHVALHHAVLRPASDDGFALQARTPSGIQINGRTAQAGVSTYRSRSKKRAPNGANRRGPGPRRSGRPGSGNVAGRGSCFSWSAALVSAYRSPRSISHHRPIST